MLVHRGKIKKAASCCINTLKHKRIEHCEKAALVLIGKNQKFMQHIGSVFYCKELSFEDAMIKAWDDELLDLRYGRQIGVAKNFLSVLKAVETEYIELDTKEAIFVGKWV